MRDRERVVVVNATPLIALTVIGRLDLLAALYSRVLVPLAVCEEVLAGAHKAGRSIDLGARPWLEVVTLEEPSRADLLADLDRGEAEVIALAIERRADLVLLDERLGRRRAEGLGFQLSGTLGVLLRAKAEGHVAAVGPLLVELQAAGIRLSEPLIKRTLELADEPTTG